MTKLRKVPVAVGIFAHNEERNIERMLKSLLASSLKQVEIQKIVVVSSGSFDRTNRLVRKFAEKDKRIILIEEAERKGKSAAINVFLRAIKTPVAITISADITVSKAAIEEIGLPFLNEEVGMVGAHPIPQPNRLSTIGAEVALLWELHHQVSLIEPKCGEMVAFRNIIRQIPSDSAVDEATIEVLLRLLGYGVVYAPRAIVYNKGPKNMKEFISQRRRVQAGHQWVYATYNYKVSTMQLSHIFKAIFRLLAERPSNIKPLVMLLSLEIWATFLGWTDFYLLGRNPYKWDMVSRN
jgi:poly-beta-1,6-N-acetyl-D-glucosamine synthase